MSDRTRRWMSGCMVALMIASSSLRAQTEASSGSDMFVDLVVTRPLGLLGIVLGSAAFVVALPFTIPSGSVARSAEELVKKPMRYTFQRALGDLPDDHEEVMRWRVPARRTRDMTTPLFYLVEGNLRRAAALEERRTPLSRARRMAESPR